MSQADDLEKGLDKFQQDNPWIFELAAVFDGQTTPIPWASVSIRGDYLRYLLPQYTAASKAIGSLNLSPKEINSSAATRAAKELFDQSKGVWSKASNMGIMAWETATGGMQVGEKELAVFSATAFLQMEYGYLLHASGVAQAFLASMEEKVAANIAKGKMTQQDGVNVIANAEHALQQHASNLNQAFGAISYLDKKGYFNAQKGMSGLGALPVLYLVLGIVAIAAIAVVLVSVYQISTVNKIITEECSRFNNEKYRQMCVHDALNKLPSIDFNAITGQLFKWLTIGALVVGGVYFAPMIARRYWKEARK